MSNRPEVFLPSKRAAQNAFQSVSKTVVQAEAGVDEFFVPPKCPDVDAPVELILGQYVWRVQVHESRIRAPRLAQCRGRQNAETDGRQGRFYCHHFPPRLRSGEWGALSRDHL